MAKCVKYLAKNLRRHWADSGLKQAEFARKLKVSTTYLNQLLNEVNANPSFDKLEQIAVILDTTVPKLISDPDAPVEIDSFAAAIVVREHLKFLAKREGISWPPTIDFLAKILK